jgi:pimeloyl-ACP methyl ester carboxylesterase
MSRLLPFLIVVILGAGTTPLQAQKFDPPPPKGPDNATLAAITVHSEKLREKLAGLKGRVDDLAMPGVEIYLKAAEWIMRHGEFFTADSGKWTLNVLDQGLQRAELAAQGKTPWLDPTNRSTARGYRSRIDGSIQPYAVSYPDDYAKVKGKTYRLDIVLHGRDATLCEVKFLQQRSAAKAIPKEQDYIQIDIYGRGNNAYRWAGESDVWEALEHFHAVERKRGRSDLLDPKRVVLRGFSMGGAGTWHLGLHHPDRFAVIGPGAGFTTTHGYIKGLPNPLPSPQEECLRIYDAIRYAENARMLPIVAYSGEKDAQKAAADNIEKRLRELKIDTMTHLVAPGLEHRFPPEWQKQAEVEWSKFAGEGKGRNPQPDEIHFTTYTLRYPSCEWVRITGLEKHYEKATITAKRGEKGVDIRTENVRSFRLLEPGTTRGWLAREATIDGQNVPNPLHYQSIDDVGYYARKEGKWSPIYPPRADRLEKRPGLQGPIDDAFMDGFLCVSAGGKPWHARAGQGAQAQLERFRREWDKYMRGILPVVRDQELTAEQIASKHLILFGDPQSNSVLAKVIDQLPLKWSADQLAMGGKQYDPATHLPVLIYPNPLNPKKYIVLNTGHTFHEAEFKGTNAQLYPRLGDYAILKPTPTEKAPAAYEVVTAGLFDEFWKLNPAK